MCLFLSFFQGTYLCAVVGNNAEEPCIPLIVSSVVTFYKTTAQYHNQYLDIDRLHGLFQISPLLSACCVCIKSHTTVSSRSVCVSTAMVKMPNGSNFASIPHIILSSHPQSLPAATTNLVSISKILPFQTCSICNLWRSEFLLTVIPWRFLQVAECVGTLLLFLVGGSIPRGGCTTVHLSNHLLKDTQADLQFGPYK